MDWKITIVSFLVAVAAISSIPFIHIEDNGDILIDKTTNTVQIVEVKTNVVESVTNAVDRAKQQYNVDWFKDSSNYIWDGWKLR
jgi:thymidylate synthase